MLDEAKLTEGRRLRAVLVELHDERERILADMYQHGPELRVWHTTDELRAFQARLQQCASRTNDAFHDLERLQLDVLESLGIGHP